MEQVTIYIFNNKGGFLRSFKRNVEGLGKDILSGKTIQVDRDSRARLWKNNIKEMEN